MLAGLAWLGFVGRLKKIASWRVVRMYVCMYVYCFKYTPTPIPIPILPLYAYEEDMGITV